MKRNCFLFCIAVFSMAFAESDVDTQKTKQFYLSAKYQASIPHSVLGADMEIGLFKENFFFSFDFGAGVIPKEYAGDGGFTFSWGGKIKPNDKFQVIPGGSFGCWLFPYPSDGDVVFPFPTFGGPFVKLLFGKDRRWFEISNRVLLGTKFVSFAAVHQVMFGFTYIR